LSRLGEHIEHLVKIAGVDHVCIGSDYSSGSMPEGVETAETLVNLTGEMLRRGLSSSDVKKIWGGNFMRLLRQCLPA
jgi:membrane dipeptidase